MQKSFSEIMLKLIGWKVVGDYPHQYDKCILVSAPHTSNWDFPVGIFVRGAVSSGCTFVAKDSLFKPPFGFIFKALNGVPVDRSKNNNFVDAIVAEYNKREKLHIIITPEGMRKKAEKFKSGFYHIAKGANIPIIPAIFNWKNKEMIFEPAFKLTNDKAADMKRLINLFIEKGAAYYPKEGLDEKTKY